MQYIEETNRIEFVGSYDVIVVGGGVAGAGAAVAAAREGLSVMIIEKTVALGGQATLGHVVKYLAMDDGYGRQVIGGISEEIMKRSIQYGYDNLPQEWKKKLGIIDLYDKPVDNGLIDNEEGRLQTYFNIPAFVFALDEMMEQEGIEVLYDTVFCKPYMEGEECTGLIVENKSGRSAYRTKMIVDASGDADVLYRCGAKCVDQDNFVSYICYDIDFDRMKDAIAHDDMYRAIPSWLMLGYHPASGEGKSVQKFYGTSVEGVNGFIKQSRKVGLDYLKQNLRRDYTMLSVPTVTAFRTTRRITGLYELKAEDVHKHFEDSIGCTGDWRKAGPVFEIPYRTLIDAKLRNVIAVGRIIASGGDAWEVTRVIPPAVMTGQAGGTATALALKNKVPLQQVNVAELQKKLEKTGVLIHE